MIVIASYNNSDFLKSILVSLRAHSTQQHAILVVETSETDGSGEIANNFSAAYHQSPGCYDTGAYNYAMLSYPEEPEYFMFQDSLEVVSSDWESIFRIPSQNKKFVGLRKFDFSSTGYYDDYIGNQMYRKMYNRDFSYTNGVVGPNFYLPNYMANKLLNYGSYQFNPINKDQARGMERVWTNLAYDCDGIAFTEDYTGHEIGYEKYIIKHYGGRQ